MCSIIFFPATIKKDKFVGVELWFTSTDLIWDYCSAPLILLQVNRIHLWTYRSKVLLLQPSSRHLSDMKRLLLVLYKRKKILFVIFSITRYVETTNYFVRQGFFFIYFTQIIIQTRKIWTSIQRFTTYPTPIVNVCVIYFYIRASKR